MKWRPERDKDGIAIYDAASAVSGLKPPAAMTGPGKILLNSARNRHLRFGNVHRPSLALDEMQLGPGRNRRAVVRQ